MKKSIITFATLLSIVVLIASCSAKNNKAVETMKEFNSVAKTAVMDSLLDDSEIQKLDTLLAELNRIGENDKTFEKTIQMEENKATYDEMNNLIIRIFACDGSEKLKNL